MRRFAMTFFAMIVAAATIVMPAPARAVGDDPFGCRIAPGTEFNFYQYCNNSTNQNAQTYYVAFAVQGVGGAGYTFTWNITGPYRSVESGCTSSSTFCNVSVRNNGVEKELMAEVTLTRAGQSSTLYSHATIFGLVS